MWTMCSDALNRLWMKLVLPARFGPITKNLALPMPLPCSVKGRRIGIDRLGMTSCGVRSTGASSSPLEDMTAWLPVSPATLPSSSLRRNDLGDPERGVLGATDSGCGLSRIGVKGGFMDVPEPLLTEELLKGDSDDKGDAMEDPLSEEIIRCPVAMIDGCTRLPALRFLEGERSPGAADEQLLLLLVVLERLLLGEKVELIVSSRLCTPTKLSSVMLATGVFEAPPVALSVLTELRDAFLPLCAPLSSSCSVFKKKVVGPDCWELVGGEELAMLLVAFAFRDSALRVDSMAA